MNRATPEFKTEVKDAGTASEAWIPSSCALCYGSCSIRVHRVDGVVTKIEGNPESAVGKGRHEEICDAELKSNFGPERGLAWFQEHGVAKWRKRPEEVYWRPFVDVRVPVYWEFMTPLYEKTDAITAPRGITIAREYYEPLPDFLPCLSHGCKGVFYNELLELDWNHVSPVNLNLDLCVRVKATLAEPDRR